MRASSIHSATRLAFLVVLAVSTAGCATKGDLRSVRTELRALAARQDSVLAELRQQRRITVDTLRNTSSQITDLRGSTAQQLREISERLDQLMELVGQNARSISGINDQLASVGRMPSGASMVGPGAVGAGGGMTSTSPDSLYQTAMDLYDRGSLAAARRAFEGFLSAFPSHPRAASAQYNLADILVQEERFTEALDAFLRVRTDFPADPKVPEALYRAALVQVQLERPDEARRLLNTVINTYPDPEYQAVRELARQKLDELGR